MDNKGLSYDECVKRHLTGEDLRFYKRSECVIPDSLYTQGILKDFFKALYLIGVIKHKYTDDMVRSYLKRLPHSKQNR